MAYTAPFKNVVSHACGSTDDIEWKTLTITSSESKGIWGSWTLNGKKF